MAANTSETYTIGYALAPKKQSSFIQPSLLQHACQKSMTLVPIDPLIPLVNQGPFDCVIHKLNGPDWSSQLDEFAKVYPDVPIIDSMDSIERLQNRISMLEVVNQLKENEEKVLLEKSGTLEEKCEKTETFGVPKQMVIESLEGLENLDELELCIGFPMIAKPLVADGSAKSHKMSLIFNREGLKKLKPNTVLQEFVNHGGVIFKVYVVGNYVKCVKRKSLADISEEKLEKTLEASMSFSQVSNLTASNYDHSSIDEDIFQNVDMPPPSFLTALAVGLRKVLGLNLFNFDVIRDVKVGNRYLVIDINYFPGYAKMPSYESVLTDFFWDVVHKKKEGEELIDDKGNI